MVGCANSVQSTQNDQERNLSRDVTSFLFAELEAHSLYQLDQNGELHLMRPFLTRQECPECKNWELFYLDTYRARDNTCLLKSMTTGHTLSDDQITGVFRHVGLVG